MTDGVGRGGTRCRWMSATVTPAPLIGPRATDAYRRAFDAFVWLSRREQLVILDAEADYLAAATGTRPKLPQQLAKEDEALAWLDRAAELLELPPRVAPTVDQYRSAQGLIPGAKSSSYIGRLFGSWALALEAFLGGARPESALQFSIRRALLGRRRTFDEYIAGVARWDRTDPLSSFRTDYDAFADEVNANLTPGEKPIVKANTVCRQTGLAWEDARACARGQLSREEALALRRIPARGKVDSGPLVGRAAAGAILGFGTWEAANVLRRPDAPRAVALIGPQQRRAWLRQDLDAFRDGRSFPIRRPFELQPQIVTPDELAARLGLSCTTLRVYLSQRPHLVPAPAGRAAGAFWWWRADVSAWLEEHARRQQGKGTRPVRRPGRPAR